MIRRPRRSPLFPSTPLFRSHGPRPMQSSAPHDAPASFVVHGKHMTGNRVAIATFAVLTATCAFAQATEDRKSTRLNSSHSQISYAVFCLKKKNNRQRAALAH